jgi:predicted GNAT family N-acyltransferase
MIDTGCLDCPYREVDGADTGENSYKAAHVWSDSIGKIVNGD